MRRILLSPSKSRLVALAAAGVAVAATQLSSTSPASASTAPTTAGITVEDTVIPAGSFATINVTAPDDTPLQISLTTVTAGFGAKFDTLTWDPSSCVFDVEFLMCTPTAGQFHIDLHIPSTATVGGYVTVRASKTATDYGTGRATVSAPQ
ncbi:hypothetical protein [Streptomyces sp. NPDC021020]|uniref:hypothetical protein n=1 Tax=Streptomyces sp. NPDC021020 TaxID=3365109 RepID=UPI0037973C5D